MMMDLPPQYDAIPPKSPLRAGFARREITPPPGTLLMGVGEAIKRPTEGVLEPLYARALALRQDQRQAIIIGLDVCFVDRATTERIQRELNRRLGVDPAAVVINASHTHAGPAVGRYYDLAYTTQHHGYVDRLVQATVEAATTAAEHAIPVTIQASVGQTSLPLSRRGASADGRVIGTPDPAGFVLRSLPICQLQDDHGRTVCLLFSASTHPVAVRGREVSPDYPGTAMRLLDEHLGLTDGGSLFLQGAAGDSRPRNLTRDKGSAWEYLACGQPEAVQAGEILAREVTDALSDLRLAAPSLRAAAVEMHWPLEAPSRAQFESLLNHGSDDSDLLRRWARKWLAELDVRRTIPSSVPLWLHGVQLAENVRLVTIEGEPVAAHGRAIERAFGDRGVTFPLGYSNGDGMYLVTSQMLDQGGYESGSYWEYGQPSPLARGMELVLQQGLKHLSLCGIR